jgi:hypothetical protein
MMIERQIKRGKESENGTVSDDSRVTAGADCSIERRFVMTALSVELGRALSVPGPGDVGREVLARFSSVSKNGWMGENVGPRSPVRERSRNVEFVIPACAEGLLLVSV